MISVKMLHLYEKSPKKNLEIPFLNSIDFTVILVYNLTRSAMKRTHPIDQET